MYINKKSILILLIIVLIAFVGVEFIYSIEKNETSQESVLQIGMKVCATTERDRICVTAVNDYQRIIWWEESERFITLIPRQERWNGKLGLVSPKSPNNLWENSNGITRAIVEEAQIKVESAERLVEGLNFPGREGYNIAYNDNGLLIMWHKSVLPEQIVLDLSIFQVLINDKKPEKIPGSQNRSIVIFNDCPSTQIKEE